MSRRTDLEAAYRATTYSVFAPVGPLHLRIGQTHAALDALLQSHGGGSWAFVTAFNPGSVRRNDDVNRARQAELIEAVRGLGKSMVPGHGVGDDGRWPPEDSVLIVDIDEAAARALGRRFGQAAIVCGELSGAARLVWVVASLPD